MDMQKLHLSKYIKTIMNLDEAIKHCLDKSKGCEECAKEHEQLANWLIELKHRREH